MPGYLVFEIEVTDPQAFERYRQVAGPIMAESGGRFVLASRRIETLEGGWAPPSLFVVEFESFEAARDFYYSERYQEVVALREAACRARGILVEGVANPS